ncbi:hypothetical protein MSG28_000997 [Choristoneura fumiferana]|uniref:Uncharacterized protein n=1 Tax=Choristoneura fumiferana TaxID=7141 RepID=A0ACC0K337_CHOFU|nr:hypothetical protein MSG28_000997 [Choristoneura fumiferana]
MFLKEGHLAKGLNSIRLGTVIYDAKFSSSLRHPAPDQHRLDFRRPTRCVDEWSTNFLVVTMAASSALSPSGPLAVCAWQPRDGDGDYIATSFNNMRNNVKYIIYPH